MNKYENRRQPRATFDFHDRGPLDGAAVKRMTTQFIDDSRRAGYERVRIVTGKGIHSSGRPMVRPQVQRTLEGLRKSGAIDDFGDAKVHEGGDGAIDVAITAD